VNAGGRNRQKLAIENDLFHAGSRS
jgi:hypothetical protein